LDRVGGASVVATAAGLALIITLGGWIVQGSGPADAYSRAPSTATGDFSAVPEQVAATASFDDRFGPSSFEDRFGAAPWSGSAAVRTEAVAPSVTGTIDSPGTPAANAAMPERAPRLAAVPMPRPAPPSVVAQAARPAARYRVASLTDTPVPAAYAPPEAAAKDSGIVDLLKKLTGTPPSDAAPAETTKDPGPLGTDPAHTAIYDISARTVYMPGGDRLEAHSGLGGYMDDVRSVHLRSRGPTPPNVYELRMRENPFHGVQAIRLVPVDGSKMYGRDGILVHPFMLGPEGASNGCVSVKDYPAFLNAYQRGEITRLVVVEQLDDPASARTAADWVSSTLKRLFGRT
jgi:hypothetical protein